jgi:hypothetical protein
MNKTYSSISIVTGALLMFTILCSPLVAIPFAFLFVYLLVLQAAFIWMVIRILKNGTPSAHTFDQKFYDDVQVHRGEK